MSDAEAKARADFDIRWKVALGIEVEDRPFAKSTLQVFRAQLILHGKVREVFESSLRLARESGYLKRRGMKVALETTNILGRGAVKDTYNLLADGMVKLLRALAAVARTTDREWAKARGYERYLASSIKGEAAIDWSDKRARSALLAGIGFRSEAVGSGRKWGEDGGSLLFVVHFRVRIHHAAQEQDRARGRVPDKEDEGPVDRYGNGLFARS